MCTSSDEGGIHHCFSLSGWIKIVESFAVFTLIMLHRIGAGVVNQMVRHQYKHSNCKDKIKRIVKIKYLSLFWNILHIQKSIHMSGHPRVVVIQVRSEHIFPNLMEMQMS